MESKNAKIPHNSCPIDTKFGAHVGLVKTQVKFEDGLCGSYEDPKKVLPKNSNSFSTKSPIFNLNVPLDRAHQGLNFCYWRYKVLNQIFLYLHMTNIMVFKLKLVFLTNFI